MARLARPPPHCQAGNGSWVAPQGVAAVLDLEVSNPARAAASERRGSGPHCRDVTGQSSVGYRAYSRRASQARHRREQALHPTLSVAKASARRQPDLADVSEQRTPGDLGGGSSGRQTLGYRIVYVLFLISHDRRRLVHFKVTSNPTSAWIWQQLIEATPWSNRPEFLIHDRDAVYGRNFDAGLFKLGITGVRTPFRAPRMNAIAERLVRTIRQECLDHVIVINERHLSTVLTEFAAYYNPDRPHRSLGLESPLPRPSTRDGPVTRRPVLGGLHHVYARAR